MLPEPGAAFRGEAVFLQAAVGFIREGPLDEAGILCGPQVVLTKGRTVRQTNCLLKCRWGEFALGEQKQNPFDWVGDWVADWVGDLTCDSRGDWVEGVHGLQIFRSIAELEGDAGAIQDEFGLG